MDKTGLDFYQREARKFCRDGAKWIRGFKDGLAQIHELCKQVSDAMLINIERKKIVEHSAFADMQVRSWNQQIISSSLLHKVEWCRIAAALFYIETAPAAYNVVVLSIDSQVALE